MTTCMQSYSMPHHYTFVQVALLRPKSCKSTKQLVFLYNRALLSQFMLHGDKFHYGGIYLSRVFIGCLLQLILKNQIYFAAHLLVWRRDLLFPNYIAVAPFLVFILLGTLYFIYRSIHPNVERIVSKEGFLDLTTRVLLRLSLLQFDN